MAKSYSQLYNQYRERFSNARLEAAAAVESLREQGYQVDDAAVEAAAEQIVSSGEFDITQFVTDPSETIAPEISPPEAEEVEGPPLPSRGSTLLDTRFENRRGILSSPEVVIPEAEEEFQDRGIVGNLLALRDAEIAAGRAAQASSAATVERANRGLFYGIIRDVYGVDMDDVKRINPRHNVNALFSAISPEWAKREMENREAYLQEEEMRQATIAQQQTARAQAAREAVGEGSLAERLATGIGQVMADPSQALPMIGGVAGGMLGGPAGAGIGSAGGSAVIADNAYNQFFQQAKAEYEASDQEAEDYARIMTAIEFGGDAVAGAAGGAITTSMRRLGVGSLSREAVGQAMARRVAGVAPRIAGAALVGAGGEVAAEGLQEVASNIMEETEFFDSPESRAALARDNAEMATNRLERMSRVALPGALIGGGISAPGAIISRASEVGAEASADSAAAEAVRNRMLRPESPQPVQEVPQSRAEPEQQDMFPATEDLPTVEEFEAQRQRDLEIEAAYNQQRRRAASAAEVEAREANRRDLLDSVSRRVDSTREAEEILQERVELGDTSQSTLNALSRATRERTEAEAQYDRLRTEPQQASITEASEASGGSLDSSEPSQLELPLPQGSQRVAARRRRLQQERERAERNMSAQERRAATRRRNDITDRILRENPALSDAEIDVMVERELAQPAQQEQGAPNLVQEAATVVNRARSNQQRQETTARRRRMEALRRQNPDATPERIAELYEMENSPALRSQLPSQEVAVPEAPVAPQQPEGTPDGEGVTTNDQLADLANRLNLGQRSRSEADELSYRDSLDRITRGLASRGGQSPVDVRNLVRQGRLAIVKNPTEVGREERGNAAEYDTETGQMYLYTDRVDPDNAVEIMAAALHESTHVGQGRSREGRSSPLRTLMGDEGYDRVNSLIKNAADRGNSVALRAVEAARNASPDATIEQLEVAPYFATEATIARGQGLGRLRGVWNDMQSMARNTMRDRLGIDLPVNLAEVESASQRAAGEALLTDPTPEGVLFDGPLGMVAGPQHPRFQEFKDAGRTYVDADGVEKFILSDSESTFNWSRGIANELRQGRSVPVSRIINNSNINEGYPQLASVPVYLDGNLEQGAAFAVLPDTGDFEVRLSPDAVDAANQGEHDYVHDIILHELQHGIQEMEDMARGGSPQQFLTPQDRRAVQQFNRTVAEANRISDDLDNSSSTMEVTPETAGEISNLRQQFQQRAISPREFANDVGTLIYEDPSANRYARNLVEPMRRVFDQLSVQRPVIDEIVQRTGQSYHDLLGEQEARFVEGNRTVPQEQLPVRPPYTSPALVTRQTGDPSPQSVTLGQRSRVDPVRDVQGGTRLAPWLVGLFRSDQGLGRTVNEIMEYARSSPGGEVDLALQNFSKYQRTMREEALSRGEDVRVLEDRMNAELDEVARMDGGYDQIRPAIKAVADKYGKAGEAYMDLRDQIDRLSLEALTQRAAQGTDLTPDERRAYTAMRHNLGRYVHRSYAVNSGVGGRKYANQVWEDYRQGRSDTANYKRVADAIEHIVDNNLYIPDEVEISDYNIDKLSTLVKTWGLGNPNSLTREQMEDRLLARRDDINGDTNRLNSMAEEITQELLGLLESSGPLTNYFRGARRDDGILQRRERVPEPIRALMGEVKHPGGALLITAAKQAEFVSRNRALLELRDMADAGQLPNDLLTPDSVGTPRAEGMVPLEGETYGALQGYLVSPNMNALLADSVQQLSTFEQAVAMAATRPGILAERAVSKTLQGWGVAAKISKVSQIVGNPVNYLYNFAGAPRMLLSNGNVSPATWVRGLDTALKLVSSARNSESSTSETRRAITNGVVDSARMGEIANTRTRSLERVFREMAGQEPSAIKDRVLSQYEAVMEFYAMMDVWSKLANFYNNADTLARFYEASGINKPQSEIDREAADITNRTNITYVRAAPFIKSLERGGITQFGTYFWETFRADIGTMMQGIDEIRRASNTDNPEAASIMRWQGAKRLSGLATAWGLTGGLSYLMSQAVFGEDEEDNKALRALLPDFLQNQDFAVVGTKNGKEVLFQVDRLDPMGPSTDFLRLAINGEASPDEVAEQFVDMYVAPRIGPQVLSIISAAITGERPSKEPLLQSLVPDAYSYAQQGAYTATGGWRNAEPTFRAFVNSAEAFAPGILGAYSKNNVRPEVDDVTSAVAFGLSMAGGRFYSLDPKRASTSVGFEYKDVMDGVRTDVRSMIADHNGTLSEGQVLERLTNMRTREMDAYRDVERVYQGMLIQGMTPKQAREQLGASGQIPKEVINTLGTGRYPSRVLSEQSIEQARDREIDKATTPEEKRQIRDKWDAAWRMLNGTMRQVED